MNYEQKNFNVPCISVQVVKFAGYLRAILQRGHQITIDIPYEYCAVVGASRHIGRVTAERHSSPITANLIIFTTANSNEIDK